MKPIVLSALCLLVCTTLQAETLSRSDILIEKIISQLRIPEQFEADLKNLPPSTTPDTKDGRIQIWLAEVRVRELGWLKVRDTYTQEMKKQFSETELQALLDRLNDPLVAKLMSAHLHSMRELAPLRAQLFNSFWQRYNSNEFIPPAEVMKNDP